MKDVFYNHIVTLQSKICQELESVDTSSKFSEDKWLRSEGGGGTTKIFENGEVFEKAGVNISKVYGRLPETMKKQLNTNDSQFYACGLSIVIHPKNPMAPTVHANWRYFEMYDKKGNISDSWFGGGQDLTPYYLFNEDAKYFHEKCKQVCDKHNNSFYVKFKNNCDNYFYNTHRKEARGIGGLFFDYCKSENDMNMNKWLSFVVDTGNNFLDSYLPIIKKRSRIKYSDNHKNWQEIRRGRYVEFNLVHDKGTLFGLRTNGRIESILMSLPPKVQWKYNYRPDRNSEEEKLINVLTNPRQWID